MNARFSDMDGSQVFKNLSNAQIELDKIKETIPQIINKDVLHSYKFFGPTQKELILLKDEHKKLKAEVTRWKNKCETAQNELRLEKEVHRETQSRLAGMKEQLSLEVQYCAKLGSSCCTLLWSLSKHGLQRSTLNTTCVLKFMEVFEETLVNFSHADTKVDPLSDEMRLVEALCGILTNISACEEGRDYLVENASDSVDLIISLLPSLVSTSDIVLRLLLMFLYNLTIHSGGQALVQKKLESQAIDTIIAKTHDNQVVLSSLRLVDSVFPTKHGVLTQESVIICVEHKNKDIREFARQIFAKGSVNEL